jgi:hypothetical protein
MPSGVHDDHPATQPPDGFELESEDSPFVEIVGPVYCKVTDHGPLYAFRTEPRHGNRMGTLFGGFAMAFVDVASTLTLRHMIDAEGIYAHPRRRVDRDRGGCEAGRAANGILERDRALPRRGSSERQHDRQDASPSQHMTRAVTVYHLDCSHNYPASRATEDVSCGHEPPYVSA